MPTQPLALPAFSGRLLRIDTKAQAQLSALVSQCFNALNVFGKNESQLSDTAGLFAFVLADYPAAAIEPAFKTFLERNSRMPTPADIAAIIRRQGRPPFDQAVYVALSRKPYPQRTKAEDAYLADYEADALGLARPLTDEARQAKAAAE